MLGCAASPLNPRLVGTLVQNTRAQLVPQITRFTQGDGETTGQVSPLTAEKATTDTNLCQTFRNLINLCSLLHHHPFTSATSITFSNSTVSSVRTAAVQ